MPYNVVERYKCMLQLLNSIYSGARVYHFTETISNSRQRNIHPEWN